MNKNEDFLAGEKRALIPEGTYRVCCIEIEKGTFKGAQKIYLKFVIYTCEYEGTQLFMAMNQHKKFPPSSKYYKAWVIANNNELPSRDDRMSPKIFEGGVFEAVVKTSKPKFPDKTEMPDCFHYSVVDYLKRRLE